MKENLIKIIEQYLKMETNHAIIMNGSYGIGKTYFFKKSLSSRIADISIPPYEKKKYIPIHISLFGINSVEEVQTQIFAALWPILKTRGLKLAAGITKSIIRGIAQVSRLGDIDKYIADVGANATEWINYDEIVLCFDDLDRKSDDLNIKDIMGFINTLVENYGAKVLIIANERTLQNDEDYTSELREKVIGVSIPFNPDIDSVYDSIIKDRYSDSFKVYFKFLEKNKASIIDVIKKNENNLRNLIFFLEYFKEIFYSLTNLFKTDVNFKVSEQEKMKVVLNFTLAISIEYKVGNLNLTNFEAIKGLNKFSSLLSDKLLTEQNDNGKEVYKLYSETFKKKYYSKDNYYYLDSIFMYITGQSAFEIDNLRQELNKFFAVENGNVPDTHKILNSLKYFNCLELDDKSYRKATNKMLGYVDQGKYQLEEYPKAFHFATRFDNLLGFNIDKLKIRFKKGIYKGMAKYKFDNGLSYNFALDNNTEFKEELLEIVNYCIDANNNVEKVNVKQSILELEQLFENDFKEFITVTRGTQDSFRFVPFWSNISLHKVYKVINKLNNNQLTELAFYFKDRYSVSIYKELYPEKDFLIGLKNKINSPQKRKVKNLRNASLDFLIKHIDESINNFSSQ